MQKQIVISIRVILKRIHITAIMLGQPNVIAGDNCYEACQKYHPSHSTTYHNPQIYS